MTRNAIRALALVALSLTSSTAAAETWSLARGTGVLRANHVAVKLESGKLLVAGGSYTPLLSIVDVYDPATDSWTRVAPMSVPRSYFCGVRLLDGRVLVAGGAEAEGVPPKGATATVEIYDEKTDKWSRAADLLAPRRWHTCTTLADGRVLLVGGSRGDATELSSAELYDPTTNTWSATGSASTTYDAGRSILLADGRVLVTAGGSADVYTPSVGTFKSISTAVPRGTVLTMLADDRVLMLGWTPAGAIFDPRSDTVSSTTPANEHGYGAASTLPDGRVLVTGGVDNKRAFSDRAEMFDPASGAWSTVDPLHGKRGSHTAFALPDGRVLLTGGVSGGGGSSPTQDEMFNALVGASCTSSAACASGSCVDGVCCESSCDGPCVACDVAGSRGKCTSIDGPPRSNHATCTPYRACVKGACPSSCSADSECAPGNVCFATLQRCAPEKGLCDGNSTVTNARGETTSCGAYACTPAGECLSKCATSSDCSAGNICNTQTGACTAPPSAPEEESSGCSMGAGSRTAGAVFLALLIAFALRRRSALLLSMLSVLGCDASEPGRVDPTTVATTRDPLWRALPVPEQPVRIFAAATSLADGNILVTGGMGETALASSVLFDATALTFRTVAKMGAARAGHTLSRLADGRVLAVGGSTKLGGPPQNSAELYDPSADQWSPAAAPIEARDTHAAVTLADGRVLLVGGHSTALDTAEIFDPATGTFTATPKLAFPHKDPAAARLADGRVLVVGGVSASRRKAELFDPRTTTWTTIGELALPREAAIARALPDGRVLVAGGPSAEVELLDPVSLTFAVGPALGRARYMMIAAQLPGGDVLMTGGSDQLANVVYADADIFAVGKGLVRPARALDVPRIGHVLEPLPDGRLLLFGGLPTMSEALPVFAMPMLINLFDGAPCSEKEACASGFCVDGRCCGSACGAACVACDVAGQEGTCVPIDGKPRIKGHASCEPYGLCRAGGCLTVCSGDDGCDDAHVCDVTTGSCIAPKATCEGTVVRDQATGQSRDCAPYRCASRGVCLQRCSSSDDCAAGAVCGEGVCTTAAAADDSGSCSVGGRGRASFALAFLMAVAAARVRRRRTRNNRGA